MKNHPRWTCTHLDKHGLQHERHTCTVCNANHPPFLCSRARRNQGPGKPKWVQAERQLAKDQNREPDYTWNRSVPPPPLPAQQAQAQPIDAAGPSPQQQAPPAEAAPLCAAAVAVHTPPQTSSLSILTSGPPSTMEPSKPTRPPSTMTCPTVRKEDRWMPATMLQAWREHVPAPGQFASDNLWNHSLQEQGVPGPLGSFLSVRYTTVCIASSLCAPFQTCDKSSPSTTSMLIIHISNACNSSRTVSDVGPT